MERVILHSDANNFYASVECLYNPELRNKPVAVCGDASERHGIVLAKNYLAKACGVTTGNPIWQAKQKCPELVCVLPHYDRYLKFSKMLREIYADYTDKIEGFGLDECWLDVSGSTKLFGNGEIIADKIRERVKKELGITVSIGVSFNKIFAKLGSDMKKPDATTAILKDNFKSKIWNLPASDLLFVGPATKKVLRNIGVNTIGDIASTKADVLQYKLGKGGLMLWRFANGYDTSEVREYGESLPIKSIGNSTTTPHDLLNDRDVLITMYVLAESVAARMRENHCVCSTVQLWIRNTDLSSYIRQVPLDNPENNSEILVQKAFKLYKQYHNGSPIRSLGIRAVNLKADTIKQLSLIPEQQRLLKIDEIETAMDKLRFRFGYDCIKRGIMLTDKDLSALDAKSDHISIIA